MKCCILGTINTQYVFAKYILGIAFSQLLPEFVRDLGASPEKSKKNPKGKLLVVLPCW